MNVLVIDDDKFIAVIFEEFCSQNNHHFYYRSNGVRAANTAMHLRADIVFLDVLMEDQEGLATLRELKTYCPEIPVYMMSGEQFYLDVAMDIGACGKLKKPFTMAEITSVMDGQSRDCTDCSIKREGLGRCGRSYLGDLGSA